MENLSEPGLEIHLGASSYAVAENESGVIICIFDPNPWIRISFPWEATREDVVPFAKSFNMAARIRVG